MIMKIYAVRDAKVEAFLQPFFSSTDGAAIRSCMEVVNDPQHPFAKHVADYTLYCLGDFDDASGIIDPQSPRLLVGLNELVHKLVS